MEISDHALFPATSLARQDGEEATSGGSRLQRHSKGLSQGRLPFSNPEIGVGSSFRVLPELFFPNRKMWMSSSNA
ncbi:hypothetical protein TNCV_180251 [Trichonephila clavipes]|nr:hypothetical protein TNCV_180251 [Trichonephila clavipes]